MASMMVTGFLDQFQERMGLEGVEQETKTDLVPEKNRWKQGFQFLPS